MTVVEVASLHIGHAETPSMLGCVAILRKACMAAVASGPQSCSGLWTPVLQWPLDPGPAVDSGPRSCSGLWSRYAMKCACAIASSLLILKLTLPCSRVQLAVMIVKGSGHRTIYNYKVTLGGVITLLLGKNISLQPASR